MGSQRFFAPAHHPDNSPTNPPTSFCLSATSIAWCYPTNQPNWPTLPKCFKKNWNPKKRKQPSSLHEDLTSFYEIDRCISNWWHTIPRPFNEVEDLREGITKSGGPPALFQQLLCGDKELQEGKTSGTSLCCAGVKTPGLGVGVGVVGLCVFKGIPEIYERSSKRWCFIECSIIYCTLERD